MLSWELMAAEHAEWQGNFGHRSHFTVTQSNATGCQLGIASDQDRCTTDASTWSKPFPQATIQPVPIHSMPTISYPSKAFFAKALIVRFFVYLFAFFGLRRQYSIVDPVNALATLSADLGNRLLAGDDAVEKTCRNERLAFTCLRKITDDNLSMDFSFATRFCSQRSGHVFAFSQT